RIAAASRSAMGAARMQRIAAESTAEQLSDKQYSLEQQVAEQQRQIAEQEKIAKTAPSDSRSGSSYGVLLVRKAELEAQLKDYSTQYTDKNPKVIQSQTQLAEINRQIAQLTAGTGENAAAMSSPEARELRTMKRELSKMQTELEVTKRELARKQQIAGTTGSAAGGSPSVVRVSSAPAADDQGLNISTETDRDRLRDRY